MVIVPLPLYQLPRDTYFELDGERYLFRTLDGMYSLIEDFYGEIHHFSAWLTVNAEIDTDHEEDL